MKKYEIRYDSKEKVWKVWTIREDGKFIVCEYETFQKAKEAVEENEAKDK